MAREASERRCQGEELAGSVVWNCDDEAFTSQPTDQAGIETRAGEGGLHEEQQRLVTANGMAESCAVEM